VKLRQKKHEKKRIAIKRKNSAGGVGDRPGGKKAKIARLEAFQAMRTNKTTT